MKSHHVPSPSFIALPEAYSLRKLRWQFFVTLTFRLQRFDKASRNRLLFAWLRDVAAIEPKIHFRSLLWVARLEQGRGSRAHFHLVIAGKPRAADTRLVCDRMEAAWRAHAGAIAEVKLYDHARDGVGYVLKIPAAFQVIGNRYGLALKNDNDGDTIPTLSNSLFETIRRGRM